MMSKAHNEHHRMQSLSAQSLRVWAFALQKYRSHIDASHSRQPLVKGERLVRYEVNAVMSASLCVRAAELLCCTPEA